MAAEEQGDQALLPHLTCLGLGWERRGVSRRQAAAGLTENLLDLVSEEPEAWKPERELRLGKAPLGGRLQAQVGQEGRLGSC